MKSYPNPMVKRLCAHSFTMLLAVSSMFSFNVTSIAQEPKTRTAAEPVASDEEKGWKPLVKADSLDGWKLTNFGGEGSVEVKAGELTIGRGDPLTGVTYAQDDFPKENFELRWKAQRVEGSDFFAGVTFPVGKDHLTFICGGWGGGLVGLSSLNGNDASENETASFRQFKNKQWYSFKIRVDPEFVKVWLDGDQIIKVERAQRRFSLRAEVLKCRPLGYCSFQSIALVKDWEYRTIEAE